MEHQRQARRLLQLLHVVDRIHQILARHHGAVVGQQEGVALGGAAPQLLGDAGIPRLVVGDERQLADPHHVVGGEGADDVGRIQPLQAGEGGQVGAVQVHHGPAVWIVVVDGEVEGHLLGGAITPQVLPLQVDMREPVGAQTPQAGAGGGGDQGAIRQQGREVAGAPGGIATLEEGGPQHHHGVAQCLFSHGSTPEPCRRNPHPRSSPT